MDNSYFTLELRKIFGELVKKGIKIDKGLSDDEILTAEKRYNIVFPPDLKELYQLGLPVGDGFYNWRSGKQEDIEAIKYILDWPRDGIVFDIENNNFWKEEWWGPKPDNLCEAIKIFEEEYKKFPQIIPIYSHRFIPSNPFRYGNPVYSIYQTDIMCYGENLLTYLQKEFINTDIEVNYNLIKSDIEFWPDLR